MGPIGETAKSITSTVAIVAIFAGSVAIGEPGAAGWLLIRFCIFVGAVDLRGLFESAAAVASERFRKRSAIAKSASAGGSAGFATCRAGRTGMGSASTCGGLTCSAHIVGSRGTWNEVVSLLRHRWSVSVSVYLWWQVTAG